MKGRCMKKLIFFATIASSINLLCSSPLRNELRDPEIIFLDQNGHPFQNPHQPPYATAQRAHPGFFTPNGQPLPSNLVFVCPQTPQQPFRPYEQSTVDVTTYLEKKLSAAETTLDKIQKQAQADKEEFTRQLDQEKNGLKRRFCGYGLFALGVIVASLFWTHDSMWGLLYPEALAKLHK